MASSENLQQLANLLSQSLVLAHARQAELSLKSAEAQPGFAILLLQIIASDNFDNGARLAGAVFFKNFIKRRWTDEDGNYLIPTNDVNTLKQEIIGLMISLPANLQVQLGEAVSIMADSDFPDRWPDLLPNLISRLGSDTKTNNGVLTVAHSIFKRWRPLFRSDALFTEIKFVLDQFCTPYLKLFQQTDELIEKSNNDKQQLTELFQTLLLIIKIYFDLNCQDIPEFFEDNMKNLMQKLHKYLIYMNPLLETEDSEESGPIEAVKSGICEILELYTQRYEDVFGPVLPDFVQTTLQLLTSFGQDSKHDLVVSRAFSFLTSVAKIQRQVNMFSEDEVLAKIVQQIILPNMALRTSDEELFEDDPMEFTRRDLEGSDSDTRRRSATDFIRELTDKLESKVTNVVMTYVRGYLDTYKSDPAHNWRAKDCAIYLFSAIAAKGNVTNAGVTTTNLLIDVVGFFAENIAPDLTATDIAPILKVDAIKYIHTFRNQLTKAQLVEAFPLLSSHLSSKEYVVYTYAAITIERILSIRINSSLMFDKSDIAPVAQNLLVNLFSLILQGNKSPEKLAENEFLIKCIMRVLVTAQDEISSYGELVLQQLVTIVNEISKNPSNPKFSHYSFESIGSLIRFCHQSIGVTKLESIVLPSFMNILGQDIQEFVPYVFQILSQLLQVTPISAGLSDSYQALVKPLMSPKLWESRGNIPALVKLLQAILSHGGKTVLELVQIEALLGIFQKLIASKANDGYGFELLEDIFYNIPVSGLEQYVSQIGLLLLQRLQSSSTDKYESKMSKFVYFLAAVEHKQGLGPDLAVKLFDTTQPGVFGQVLSRFILPSTLKIRGFKDRKISAIGLTNLLVQNSEFSQGQYRDKWIPTCEVLVQLLKTPIPEPISDADSLRQDIDSVDEHTFGASFVKLATASLNSFDPVPSVKDPVQYFVAALKQASPTVFGLMEGLPDEVKQYISSIRA